MTSLLNISYQELLNNINLDIPKQSKCFVTGVDKDSIDAFVDLLSGKISPTDGIITLESDDIVKIDTVKIDTVKIDTQIETTLEPENNPLMDILNIKSLNKNKEFIIYLYNALCKQADVIIINDAFKDLDTITRLRLLKYLKGLPITVIYASSRYIADVCFEEWSSMIVLVSRNKVCDYHPLSLKTRHKNIYKSLLYKLSVLTIYEQQQQQ